MLPELAAQERKQKDLLRKFERALIASDIAALDKICSEIAGEFIWPRALRRAFGL